MDNISSFDLGRIVRHAPLEVLENLADLDEVDLNRILVHLVGRDEPVYAELRTAIFKSLDG